MKTYKDWKKEFFALDGANKYLCEADIRSKFNAYLLQHGIKPSSVSTTPPQESNPIKDLEESLHPEITDGTYSIGNNIIVLKNISSVSIDLNWFGFVLNLAILFSCFRLWAFGWWWSVLMFFGGFGIAQIALPVYVLTVKTSQDSFKKYGIKENLETVHSVLKMKLSDVHKS